MEILNELFLAFDNAFGEIIMILVGYLILLNIIKAILWFFKN